MSVFMSTIFRIKPGRYADAMVQAARGAQLYERFGTNRPRLLSAGLAGEAFGTWTFSVDFEDLESFGTITDQYSADPDSQAYFMQLQEADNPVTLEQLNVGLEIPVRESKGGRGNVIALYAAKVHPGGLERALALGVRACDFAEAHGALDARMFSLLASGSGTGITTTMFEYEDMRAFTTVIEAFNTEPAGQAIAVEGTAADSPVTTVFEAVYNEVPY